MAQVPPSRPGPAVARGRLLVPTGDDDRVAIVAVIALALLLRLWQLGAQSLWTDEGSAWTAASLPLRALVDFCLHKDASPPLFYLLTKLALQLGPTEANLRLVSVVASTLLVWVTYRLARLGADRRTSTIAAALVAVSPFQLMYAQEARTYALVALWSVLSFQLFLRAAVLDRPRAWAPFVLVTALGLWTQSLAVLGLGVQAALLIATPAGRRRMPRWLGMTALAVALFSPWILLSAGSGDLGSSHWYLKPPRGSTSYHVVRALLLSPISLVTPPPGATLPGLDRLMPRALAWLLLYAPPGLAFAAALPRLRDPAPRGPLTVAMLAALVLPLVAVFAVSFWRPLWLPRYFVLLTPYLAVLMAIGVRGLRPGALSMTTLGLLFAVYGYGDFRYYTDATKERWREVVGRVAAASDPDSTIVIVTFDPDPFLFYDAKLRRPFPVVAAAHPDVPFHDRYTPVQLAEIGRALGDSTARFPEVWVVVRSPNSPVRKEVAALAHRVAGAGRRALLADSLDAFGGPLRFARYRRAAAAAGAAPAESLRAAGR